MTPAEQNMLQRASDWTSGRIWAAKEAAYKACNRGEPFTPRRIESTPLGTTRLRCTCRFPRSPVSCDVRLRRLEGHALAIAVAPRRSHHIHPSLAEQPSSYFVEVIDAHD